MNEKRIDAGMARNDVWYNYVTLLSDDTLRSMSCFCCQRSKLDYGKICLH